LSNFPQWCQGAGAHIFSSREAIGKASWKLQSTLTMPDSNTISKAGFKDERVLKTLSQDRDQRLKQAILGAKYA
jgi:hypothetical protein